MHDARVDKGMYGLPQAGKVASDHLIPRLKEAGYEETGRTQGDNYFILRV